MECFYFSVLCCYVYVRMNAWVCTVPLKAVYCSLWRLLHALYLYHS